MYILSEKTHRTLGTLIPGRVNVPTLSVVLRYSKQRMYQQEYLTALYHVSLRSPGKAGNNCLGYGRVYRVWARVRVRACPGKGGV